MARQQCRFYEPIFPEVDDVVMVNVYQIAEMGAYVHLLEYNNIEGMILLSELSRRRIRSINKLIRIGRNEVVVVLRVDKEKGYIDLSKRRVSAEEYRKCEDKYMKAKTVNSILRYVAETCNIGMEELAQKTAWVLDKRYGGPGKSYDAFKLAVSDVETVFSGIDIDPAVREMLLKTIRLRMTPQATKIRADIQVSCFAYEGVDAVKESLRKALALSTEDVPINITLIAPPLYIMTTNAIDKESGVDGLAKAIDVVREHIEKQQGSLTVISAPRAVSDLDEQQLANMLEDLERQAAEMPGDSDESESEEE